MQSRPGGYIGKTGALAPALACQDTNYWREGPGAGPRPAAWHPRLAPAQAASAALAERLLVAVASGMVICRKPAGCANVVSRNLCAAAGV